MNGKRTAGGRFFFAGGRAEAAWSGSGKEKSCRYFLPKAEKIFQRRGRNILAARTQKAACLPVVGDRPFCCFSEAE